MKRALLGVAALCAACTIQDGTYEQVGGSPINFQALDQVVKGKTTRSELVAALGPPTQVMPLAPSGEVLIYEFKRRREAEEMLLGITVRRHVQLVTDRVTVEIDGAGRVATFRSDHSTEP